MEKIAVIDKIRKSNELLSLPQAISEILKEMNKPDFSADTLSQIILKDPSLTSRILKLANSPFYHRMAQITNVNQAVQILGVTTVKCLALSSSILNPEKIEKTSGVDTKVYFTSILTVATAAEKIARAVSYDAPDEAFIAGLLHDIGTMFFLHYYPERYRMIVEQKVRAKNLIDAELEVFEVNHAEVGYHLAQRWQLPEYITNGIREHHSFANLDNKETIENIIKLASLLANNNSSGFVMDLEERLDKINQISGVLGLKKEQVDLISSSLISYTIKQADYLGVDIGDIEEMITRANKEIWQTYLMVENLFKERQSLSRKLLNEERARGAIESKNIAIATLSHYLNNAAMAIYGRSQLMRMLYEKGKTDKVIEDLDSALNIIDKSIKKITAVVSEIKEISPIDKIEFYNMSQALNIDDRIEKRMQEMEKESSLVLPDEAMNFAD
ncbi:MAG: HDOD domain-containing protein [candidate division Zixibacteria bacterium]|nr:HDOD domain-containing protein [candidate division Zixibacteria bacterium]